MLVLDYIDNTYEIQDLVTQEIQKVHVDRLKAYHHDLVDSDLDVATLDDELYIVDQILEHSGSWSARTKMKFKVRWRDYGTDADTWEPYSHVKNLEALKFYMHENDHSFN